MSELVQQSAIELLWKQWTAVGVAGVVSPAGQAVDIEAMIALTPFVAAVDPRLADESLDWCMRFGKRFVSISRLRQIHRLMPSRAKSKESDLATILIEKLDVGTRRLSHKSRDPMLSLPSLLQLRSRSVFGVGARADVLARLAVRGSVSGAQRIRDIAPTGYTKQTIATVLDELAQAGVIEKFAAGQNVSYSIVREAALAALLAPLPRTAPPWVERFAIAAHVLDSWRRYGERATYVVELAKVIDRLLPVIAKANERPPSGGHARALAPRIARWAAGLLEDDDWETSWMLDRDDIVHEILQALEDNVVETVRSGHHPVGHTGLEELQFRNVDRHSGTADFNVQFSAEHPKGDVAFNGYVDGTFHFDPDAETKDDFLQSLQITKSQAHFDLE